MINLRCNRAGAVYVLRPAHISGVIAHDPGPPNQPRRFTVAMLGGQSFDMTIDPIFQETLSAALDAQDGKRKL